MCDPPKLSLTVTLTSNVPGWLARTTRVFPLVTDAVSPTDAGAADH